MGILNSIRDTKARIDARTARITVEEKLERARKGTLLARVSGVQLYEDRVIVTPSHPSQGPPVTITLTPATTATVDTAGAISSRVTATRLVAMGPFALAATKKNDGRELYLYIEDPAAVQMVSLPPEQAITARQLAVQLANAVINLDANRAARAAEIADLEAQLAELNHTSSS